MENLGGLENEEVREEKEERVTAFEEKKQKMPWFVWEVNGKEYRLKLTTSNILKLENKYRCNITGLVMGEDIPPLSVMLTIINAALLPYHHGISYQDVQKIYDSWAEDGGNQQLLFAKVVLPVMAVSGFFTEKQIQALNQTIEEDI